MIEKRFDWDGKKLRLLINKNCGAAEIRTLVLSKPPYTLYMFSLLFDFRNRIWKKTNLIQLLS